MLAAAKKLVQEALPIQIDRAPLDVVTRILASALPAEQAMAAEPELLNMARRAAATDGCLTRDQLPLLLARAQVQHKTHSPPLSSVHSTSWNACRLQA